MKLLHETRISAQYPIDRAISDYRFISRSVGRYAGCLGISYVCFACTYHVMHVCLYSDTCDTRAGFAGIRQISMALPLPPLSSRSRSRRRQRFIKISRRYRKRSRPGRLLRDICTDTCVRIIARSCRLSRTSCKCKREAL